ncbi:MAG TPA: hypothetical protein PKA80_08295, partial [Ignavibacteriaceae bacterium]|nr:hypothetical protein [Ignavibacteriaceae bacterium]
SFKPLAFPAVTEPFLRNAGFSPASQTVEIAQVEREFVLVHGFVEAGDALQGDDGVVAFDEGAGIDVDEFGLLLAHRVEARGSRGRRIGRLRGEDGPIDGKNRQRSLDAGQRLFLKVKI